MDHFLAIRKIINEWDPIDLIVTHFPEDEYDREVEKILDTLQPNPDRKSLAIAIHNVFLNSFSDRVYDKTPTDCEPVAGKIMEYLATRQ